LKQFSEKKPPAPKPVLLEVEELNDKNYETCQSLCIVGCANDKEELTLIARKYQKDKLKFFWAKPNSKICQKFKLENISLDLVALRGKKSKYLISNSSNVKNSERFFETVLFGGKFETLESFPLKDEL